MTVHRGHSQHVAIGCGISRLAAGAAIAYGCHDNDAQFDRGINRFL